MLPIAVTAQAVKVGLSKPLGDDDRQRLERDFRRKVDVVEIPDSEIVEGLKRLFTGKDEADDSMKAIFDSIVELALDEHGGDLHFQWVEHGSDRRGEVLLRVDRGLYQIGEYTKAEFEKLLRVAGGAVSAANTDPFETKTGVYDTATGRSTTLRFQAMPDYRGAVATIRLIGSSGKRFTLRDLGLAAQVEAALRILLKRPGGMLLTIGPPHSGKTTLLWTLVNEIIAMIGKNQRRVKVLSGEDAVEVPQDTAVQVEVNEDRGVSYPRFLTGANRSDTDITVIGEISDQESCQHAMQVALSVRYNLASMHARDGFSAVQRILEWGVPPSVLMSGLRAIVVQRLLPLLCDECKKPAVASPYARRCLKATLKDISPELFTQVFAEGDKPDCGTCGGKRRYGSRAVVEVVPMSARVLRIVCNPQSTYEEIEQEFTIARRLASGDGRGKNLTIAVQAAALFLDGLISEDAMFEAEIGGDWEREES
ncbi:MAG TPA: ATPase, T2SS/T4P/T4SS family [Candidatus Baltobacteraceae bacterium]|nr:ATPase, T2SS/T4P/T4SS family [Candidatus Baltobacteraceae bacterium]